jgi:hypothetical protein
MNISFADSLPSECTKIDAFLRGKGFACMEEDSADTVRWHYYYTDIKKGNSNILIRITLRFELCISDDPEATYDENHDLSFNDAYLSIYDRQMAEDGYLLGEQMFDEDTENIKKIDNFPISPKTFGDIEKLLLILRS